VSPLNEQEIIRKASAGDPEAFTTLYNTYSRFVYNRCLQLARSSWTAEDLSQDVFLQVWKNLAGFRGASTLKTWLYRIATNTALQYMRKLRSRPALDYSALPANGDDSIEKNLASADPSPDDSLLLLELLPMLTPAQRDAMILHDVKGYKHHEISKILHISSGTSKSNLSRGRSQIKAMLRQSPTPSAQNKIA
jgi:RNA polymerase sigma-70 factor, ECF subfamily